MVQLPTTAIHFEDVKEVASDDDEGKENVALNVEASPFNVTGSRDQRIIISASTLPLVSTASCGNEKQLPPY